MFVLFYTLIQLFEAIIYSGYNNIMNRLITMNLGLQGLVFILLLNNIKPVHKNYIYLFLFISLYSIYNAIKDDKYSDENMTYILK
jgi:hypothetical protein